MEVFMEKTRVTSNQAIIMLLVSIITIFGGVLVVGAPTTITLLAAGFLVIILSLSFGIKWDKIQEGILQNINSMMVPILILIFVGMLVGSWVSSGTVPYMIYIGLKFLSPKMFLFITCLVASIMSVMMGTSWGTISTVGVALMGVSAGLGVPLHYTAGAIVVGAIFGDKLSPLSDTTVLASAVSEVDIVDHIKQMLYTTLPGYIISLILYLFLGFRFAEGTASGENVQLIMDTLSTSFNLNPILLLPPVVVLFLIFKRKPTLPVFGVGVLLGFFFAIIFQGASLSSLAGALNGGFSQSTGVDIVDSMLLRGGISSMLGTVALLIAAAIFGAPLRTSGVIDVLLDKIKNVAKSWKSILTSTFILHGLFFVIAGSYYVTFSVLGPMFTPLYKKYKLDGVNLSSMFENTGTAFAPLVPWSVTGAFVASTLGVPTLEYALYAPMLYLGLVLSLFYFMTGITIKRIPDDEQNKIANE